jgi:hypothetical protein
MFLCGEQADLELEFVVAGRGRRVDNVFLLAARL